MAGQPSERAGSPQGCSAFSTVLTTQLSVSLPGGCRVLAIAISPTLSLHRFQKRRQSSDLLRVSRHKRGGEVQSADGVSVAPHTSAFRLFFKIQKGQQRRVILKTLSAIKKGGRSGSPASGPLCVRAHVCEHVYVCARVRACVCKIKQKGI